MLEVLSTCNLHQSTRHERLMDSASFFVQGWQKPCTKERSCLTQDYDGRVGKIFGTPDRFFVRCDDKRIQWWRKLDLNCNCGRKKENTDFFAIKILKVNLVSSVFATIFHALHAQTVQACAGLKYFATKSEKRQSSQILHFPACHICKSMPSRS